MSIILDFELDKIAWLTFMYGIHEKWNPAYCMNTFLTGMRSTQRAEAMNSFFRNFVNRKLSLVEFYMRFVLA